MLLPHKVSATVCPPWHCPSENMNNFTFYMLSLQDLHLSIQHNGNPVYFKSLTIKLPDISELQMLYIRSGIPFPLQHFVLQSGVLIALFTWHLCACFKTVRFEDSLWWRSICTMLTQLQETVLNFSNYHLSIKTDPPPFLVASRSSVTS